MTAVTGQLPRQPRTLVLAAALIAMAAASSYLAQAQEGTRRLERLVLGSLALDYDPARWQRCAANAADNTVWLENKRPESHRAAVKVIITATKDTACTRGTMVDRAAAYPLLSGTRDSFLASATTIGTLTINLATVTNVCRNSAGSPVFACVSDGSTTYLIDGTSPASGGNVCRYGSNMGSFVLDLLSGLSIVPLQ